tara:strand:- start:530 stop:958 length:429 start_codon:yes stop_codon:yes gene_type:complete
MSRIIKTVSLDESSDKLASKIPNFSKWVRDQLKLQDESFQNSHVTLTQFREKGICNPNASPRCNICFPHGRPQLTDIKDYNTGRISSEELQEITKKKFSSVNQSKTLAISKKIESGKGDNIELTIPKRKYLRRTLRYIWSFI